MNNLPACFWYIFSHFWDLYKQCSNTIRIQHTANSIKTGYVSNRKNDVWPVRRNRHYIWFTSNSILLFVKSRLFWTIGPTGYVRINLVALESCYHCGTSKKTKVAQNLTPEYMFCAGTLLTRTEQDVIWAPLSKNMNMPDFLIYWT